LFSDECLYLRLIASKQLNDDMNYLHNFPVCLDGSCLFWMVAAN